MDFQKLFAGAVSLVSGAQQLHDVLSQEKQRRRQLEAARPRSLPAPRPRGGQMTMQTHQVRNIKERVKFIQKQVAKARNDPQFRALAVKVVSKKCGTKHCIKERDYLGEVRALYEYIRKHVRYVRDPLHADLFQHPKRTLEFGGGDCDDYTITLGAMLEAIGYPVKARVIQTVESPDFDHIYLMVGVPPHSEAPRWLALDASVSGKKPGWQPPAHMVKRFRDFPIS